MKRWISILLAAMLLCLSGCGGDRDDTGDKPPSEQEQDPLYSFEGTVFTYGENRYDIAKRSTAVLSIAGCKPAGQRLVVEGHCGPRHSVYSIFNTETLTFEKDIAGANLIWREDDIATAVYSFWSEVYDYDGNLIGECALEEPDFIYELRFTGNGVRAVILNNAGEERAEEFDFPAARILRQE